MDLCVFCGTDLALSKPAARIQGKGVPEHAKLFCADCAGFFVQVHTWTSLDEVLPCTGAPVWLADWRGEGYWEYHPVRRDRTLWLSDRQTRIGAYNPRWWMPRVELAPHEEGGA